MMKFTLRMILACLVYLMPCVAHADSGYDAALKQLGSGDFDEMAIAVTRLGNSGDERVLVVLEALDEGVVFVDEGGRLFRKSSEGASPLFDISGAPQGNLKELSVNNRVRRALSPSLARLRLSSRDVAVRRTAAEGMLHSSEDSLPLLQAARERENDASVRKLLDLGIARIYLASKDDALRLIALESVIEHADLNFKTEVEALVAELAKDEKPRKTLLKAANRAISAIENKARLVNLVANTFYGLSLGSVLLLAALGLAITFGLMNVINMAHGEMLMIGAYTTFVVQSAFAEHAPDSMDWYLLAAVPSAFVVAASVGMLLERLVVRHLYGRPLETLLATWGISLMLIQTVRLIFGAQNVTVANPSWLSGGFELMPNLVMPYSRLAIVLFTMVIVGAVALLFRATRFGLEMRAVTQNRAMAASMGIYTRRVDLMTFGLGSGVAGLGGVAISQLGNVGPELGQGYIVDSFMVVVLGGVGKLVGSIVGAMGIGLANKYIEPLAGAVLGKIALLVLIVLFLQKRPRGLFALKGRSAEVV